MRGEACKECLFPLFGLIECAVGYREGRYERGNVKAPVRFTTRRYAVGKGRISPCVLVLVASCGMAHPLSMVVLGGCPWEGVVRGEACKECLFPLFALIECAVGYREGRYERGNVKAPVRFTTRRYAVGKGRISLCVLVSSGDWMTKLLLLGIVALGFNTPMIESIRCTKLRFCSKNSSKFS